MTQQPQSPPPPVLPGRMYLRVKALDAAVTFLTAGADSWLCQDVVGTAQQLYAWLTAPVSLSLTFGPVTGRATQTPAAPAATPGASLMANLELGDVDQVTATAVALDADNQPTTDTLTWTASVPAAVSLNISADTMSCVIDGLVPTPDVVITATDSLGNTTTGELDVVAGPATSLSLQFGPVTARPAPGTSTAAGETGTAPAAA